MSDRGLTFDISMTYMYSLKPPCRSEEQSALYASYQARVEYGPMLRMPRHQEVIPGRMLPNFGNHKRKH